MSRIQEVKTHAVSVPLARPLWTAHEPLDSASVILVEVKTDDGLAGCGQIHGAPMKAICEWVDRFGRIIQGMEATANVDVWEKLFALTSPRPGGYAGRDGLPPPLPRGQRPQIMAAIGGIDIALWDIKGKQAGTGSPARAARSGSPAREGAIRSGIRREPRSSSWRRRRRATS